MKCPKIIDESEWREDRCGTPDIKGAVKIKKRTMGDCIKEDCPLWGFISKLEMFGCIEYELKTQI